MAKLYYDQDANLDLLTGKKAVSYTHLDKGCWYCQDRTVFTL